MGRTQTPKKKMSKAKKGIMFNGCTCGLLDCVVMQPELFGELVQFLPPLDLAHMCDTLELSRAARPILFDEQRWMRLIQEHCDVDLNANEPLQVQHMIKVHAGCKALVDYLNLRGQLKTFREKVHVIMGDLGQIERIGDQAIDCFVFPTSRIYRNPHVGVSGRIHGRAGPQLDQWIARKLTGNVGHNHTGSILATPGFDTRAHLLVHCVGPYHLEAHRDKLLGTTYVNALFEIQKSATPIQCAAIASISTGAMGYPVNSAACIAMRAVRDVIRTHEWLTTLAFVCFDERTYNEFTSAKNEVLKNFHVSALEYSRVLT